MGVQGSSMVAEQGASPQKGQEQGPWAQRNSAQASEGSSSSRCRRERRRCGCARVLSYPAHGLQAMSRTA